MNLLIRKICSATALVGMLCLSALLPVNAQESSRRQSTTEPKRVALAPSYAWTITDPLGERYPSTIDTLQYNYQRETIPSMVSDAYATTGNLGAEGINMIFFDREDYSQFFFADALRPWMPSIRTQKFYNTRIPMTLMSYTSAGGKQNGQEDFKTIFSGNVNKAIEIGASIDYLYSKGCYDKQADKNFNWSAFGSYLGDRYELQAFYNHFSLLNKENGGISDDRYITNIDEMTEGSGNVSAQTFPVNLSAAHSNNTGQELYINNRYKVGFYHVVRDSIDRDSIISKTYIPVTSFIWTLNYKAQQHRFLNTSASEDTAFFKNTYLQLGGTDDYTTMWSLRNTFGIQLLEGFNRYAKFGLAAYITHEFRRFNQTTDTMLYVADRSELLTPMPTMAIPATHTENVVWAGGQLTKQRGSLLTYSILGQLGIVGPVAGDVNIGGDVSTKFKLFGDSVTITGYGHFKNTEVPYLLTNYISNHYVWRNDFGKMRSLRLGGRLNIPHTGTHIDVGVEDLQNYVYFNNDALPTQYDGNIQVLSARLNQNLAYRALHWDNSITYQKSSATSMLPLPQLTVYSNLYLQFVVSHVLHVQLGVDCDYYTAYKGYAYNPATMTFYTQNEVSVGNYPFMNVYATCKLQKTRFFVMMSHVNKGIIGDNNYFSLAHYPLNPRRFQIGLTVDFAN